MLHLRICSILCAAALLAVPGTALAEETEVGEMTGDTATAVQTTETNTTCTNPVLSTPLIAFGDLREYFTPPGGRFEDRGDSGWKLSGNAQYNNPNSPFAVLGLTDRESLRLQPGGIATSPAFCVDVNYPSFRFFLADFQARGGNLKVEVIYPDMKGDNVLLAAKMQSGKEWQLTPDVMLTPEYAGTDPGWRKVALRFKASGDNADFRVDDLIVDPYRTG